jgi:hypothetical protein
VWTLHTDGLKEQLAYVSLGKQGAQDCQTLRSFYFPIGNKGRGQKWEAESIP